MENRALMLMFFFLFFTLLGIVYLTKLLEIFIHEQIYQISLTDKMFFYFADVVSCILFYFFFQLYKRGMQIFLTCNYNPYFFLHIKSFLRWHSVPKYFRLSRNKNCRRKLNVLKNITPSVWK